MKKNKISKFIALILRHRPEEIGISLDEHGWANVDELIAGISKTTTFNMEMLIEIVEKDNKSRYSFNEDMTLIRANQGHSIPVGIELEEFNPPEILYHGSATKFESSINDLGLLPKSRLYVHLSKDYETAINVGRRHGKPIVYKVLSGKMKKDGYTFYCSQNGIWLTKKIPPVYLEKLGE